MSTKPKVGVKIRLIWRFRKLTVCWLDSDGHQTVQIYVHSDLQLRCFWSLVIRRQTGQLNCDSRWDSKCIDQNVHMCKLIKVFTSP